ncbi:hypothetical protein [Nocardia sp. NPDC058480]|uniref:hypothetical protein n=1 Tax=unclassified Nocardia TaxID=2637762 RepID=UPI00366044DC
MRAGFQPDSATDRRNPYNATTWHRLYPELRLSEHLTPQIVGWTRDRRSGTAPTPTCNAG